MYQSFTVKNFRCFRDLTIESFNRVNLIAGTNNVGKTALLEALFLHIGPNNPDMPRRITVLRGIERLDPQEMWEWLFSGKEINQSIKLTSIDENQVHRSLEICLAEPDRAAVVPVSNGDSTLPQTSESLTTANWPRELVLDYEDTTGQKGTTKLFIGEGEAKIQQANLAPFPIGRFLSTRARFLKDDAESFSNLERKGRQDEVLATLQLLEPRLRRLAVLITGGVPMINGDIGMGELVPVAFMGEGMGRLLSVLFAIANSSNGTVLIDEIENGLHQSIMTKVWQAIADAARRSNTQIFATTHSWECICAAHQAFEASETYDFRLHRLDRINDEIRAVKYDQEMLSTAIATGLEVR